VELAGIEIEEGYIVLGWRVYINIKGREGKGRLEMEAGAWDGGNIPGSGLMSWVYAPGYSGWNLCASRTGFRFPLDFFYLFFTADKHRLC
jgi:hypothetical protein